MLRVQIPPGVPNKYVSVAQMVEHWCEVPGAVGSLPTRDTIINIKHWKIESNVYIVYVLLKKYIGGSVRSSAPPSNKREPKY